MEKLLVVRHTNSDAVQSGPFITEDSQENTPDDPKEVLELLRNEPDLQTVHKCLAYLHKSRKGEQGFDIGLPSPQASQIVQVLVSNTIPNYWPQLKDGRSSEKTKALLVQALRSVIGIGAILARLRSYSARKPQGLKLGSPQYEAEGSSFIHVLEEIFDDDMLLQISSTVFEETTEPQRKNLWRELIQLVASTRVISTVAEAEHIFGASNDVLPPSWLGSGVQYSRWLTTSIARLALAIEDDSGLQQLREVASQALANALSMGYNGIIVEQLIRDLRFDEKGNIGSLKALVSKLKAHEQARFLKSLLEVLSQTLETSWRGSLKLNLSIDTPKTLAGCIAFLKNLTAGNQTLKEALVEEAMAELNSANRSNVMLRLIIGALNGDQDVLERIMEQALDNFGDKLFIKHATILQQEITAQKLLLATGYLHRMQPMFVFTIVRSSTHTRGISNRLAASSQRARWLGMIVGMALSNLIDKPESRLVFDSDELKTDEAKWYLQLVQVDDRPGSIKDFRDAFSFPEGSPKPTQKNPRAKAIQKSYREASSHRKISGRQEKTSKVLKIVELDEDDSADDIVPYGKPDSDPSDSDDDPTVVQRSKPNPPVYIRDLLGGLRETENYDRFHLALSNAADLIRRKSRFGKEVTDHAEELASILTNLNDPFDTEDFEDLRQSSLIATLVAKPSDIARFLVTSFFSGDYSIQQRTAILTTLGLGARELAGYKDSCSTSASASFPSKQLPPHLHALYSSTTPPASNALSRTAATLERASLEPMAIQAADSLTGPNALKVRPFSSRLDPTAQARRTKKIDNRLAGIVAENFFFPLTGRFQALHSSKSSSGSSVFLSPYLLPTFLRTLGVIITSAGPGTLALPTMTRELWDLLLSLRATALAEKEVGTLEALMFAFLMVLEVNEDKERLAREHGRELVETREWCGLVLERMQDGGAEGERVRMVAAGVVVRIGEVMERWRRLFTGGLMEE